MKQINIATLARPEEALTAAAARQVNGGTIVCTAAGCVLVLPYAPVGYPPLPLPYPTDRGYVAPFNGPLVAAPYFEPPIVPIVVRGRRRHRRW
jgi:hypothetical protein